MKKKKTFLKLTGKKITVIVRIYRDGVMLILDSREGFRKYILKEYELELEPSDNVSGKCIELAKRGKCSDIIIWMPSFDWTIQDQKTLSHELCHATHKILSKRGVNGAEEEAYAYLYEYLFGEFWLILKKEYEKISRKKRK